MPFEKQRVSRVKDAHVALRKLKETGELSTATAQVLIEELLHELEGCKETINDLKMSLARSRQAVSERHIEAQRAQKSKKNYQEKCAALRKEVKALKSKLSEYEEEA